MKHILFAAAGSGGHLFPALAIAKELENKFQCHFLTTGRDLEEKIPKNYILHAVKKVALRHQGVGGLFKFFFEFPKMFFQIRNLYKKHHIEFVIGMGGYTSGPALLVARICGIQTALLEPNATIGLSNQLSLPFVSNIFSTFLSNQALKKYSHKTYNVGLPQLENVESDLPFQNWDLIVMGGSQGANGINIKIAELIRNDFLKGKKVLWQTGGQWLKENPAVTMDGIIQVPFVKNIKAHLAKSKVAISRTGAGACSDIVDTLTPSILIPLSQLNDPHYLMNAKILVGGGAAILYQEHEPLEQLTKILQNLFSSSLETNKLKDNLKKYRYNEVPSKKIAHFVEERLNVSP